MQRLSKSAATKSRRFCSVPQCSSYSTKTISLHNFPNDLELCKHWKSALKINKPISEFMFVCSLHFRPENFIFVSSSGKSKRLKRGVIPSQNLPVTTRKKVKRMSRKKLKRNEGSTDSENSDVVYVETIDVLALSPDDTEKDDIKPINQLSFQEDKSTQTEFSNFIEIRYRCSQCTMSS